MVLVPDAVGGDVLGDLGVDRLLVGLVDLDDLLDLPVEVAFEQVANLGHDPPAYSSSRSWAIANDLLVRHASVTRVGQ